MVIRRVRFVFKILPTLDGFANVMSRGGVAGLFFSGQRVFRFVVSKIIFCFNP